MAAKKKAVSRKPKGWSDAFGDVIPFWDEGRKKGPAKKVVTKSLKGVKNAGVTTRKTAKTGSIAAFGDPSKGWKDVAFNSATWLLPYGTAFKAVDKSIKGVKAVQAAKGAAKGAKGAKKVVKAVKAGSKAAGKRTVRGAAKGAILAGGITATDKAYGKVNKRK